MNLLIVLAVGYVGILLGAFLFSRLEIKKRLSLLIGGPILLIGGYLQINRDTISFAHQDGLLFLAMVLYLISIFLIFTAFKLLPNEW
ncbi:MAG: hypothetical protein JWM92_10 [Candidatus Nomurabacteria bacterium]|jgi:hypothetical protein|nr:hypothetical protein [Candidatus Nomurabacteria bacterium]